MSAVLYERNDAKREEIWSFESVCEGAIHSNNTNAKWPMPQESRFAGDGREVATLRIRGVIVHTLTLLLPAPT